ncbi:MAG TPA: hypothetical protein PLA77_02430, partial [Bacteroidales bacterium]|nr:hypothetical protein [Bacteroidales bacterium]
MKKRISIYLILVAGAIAFTTCSTEKNTTMSRFYHNTTAHYNIYFNANEAYKKGIKQAEAANTDNYVAILPMFIISKPEAASAVTGDMDKTIKKSSKAIKFHSITAKPKTKSGKMSAKDKEFYNKKELKVIDSFSDCEYDYKINNEYVNSCKKNLDKSYHSALSANNLQDDLRKIINKKCFDSPFKEWKIVQPGCVVKINKKTKIEKSYYYNVIDINEKYLKKPE